MIKTFFGSGTLDTPLAFLAALIIGIFFGLVLERAGFGSSRRLTGVFYFTDLAVLKVMFSAMITAMIGLAGAQLSGIISLDQIYLMPTVYGAQLVGGLIFGVGFVMGGWCPGTAAVGAASGKLDAIVFLGGTVVGSIIFNELFPLIQPWYTWGHQGIGFIHQTLNLNPGIFILFLTILALASFWGAEFLEKPGGKEHRGFLIPFSLVLVSLAGGLLLFPLFQKSPVTLQEQEKELMAQLEAAIDHLEPEELAAHLLQGYPNLLLVDIRTNKEYETFHLRGALNIPLNQLAEALTPHKDKEFIVLYSNGMTHPAQARDSLYRQGFRNVYILSEGLKGFLERCLKPVSLRDEFLPPDAIAEINKWRNYFGNSQ